MYNNSLKDKVIRAIENSEQFENIFNDTLDDVITEKLETIDVSYYMNEIKEIIEDNLDIDDYVRDKISDVTRDKVESLRFI